MHLSESNELWGSFPRVTRWLPNLVYERFVRRGFAHICTQLIDALPPRVGPGPCLDVGCGAGGAVLRMAEQEPTRQVIGVDISPAMVGTASMQAKEKGIWNAHFELGDACALAFPDDSASLVWSMASIKHWSQPVRGLDELFRVAVPGASIVLVELDRDASSEIIRRFVEQWQLVPGLVLESLPVLQRAAEVYFRRMIAGQSYRIQDIQGMARASSMATAPWQVELVPNAPFWMLQAHKPILSV